MSSLSLLEPYMNEVDVASVAPSAEAILPVTAADMMASQQPTASSFYESHATVVHLIAAMFLLSCLAAVVTYLHLLKLDKRRRDRLAAVRPVSMPGVVLKKPNMEKVTPLPDSKAAEAASKSAPETPEQVYTPKQDRRGSRDLTEEVEGEPAPTGAAGAQSGASQPGAPVSRSPLSAQIDDGEQHHKWAEGGEYFGEWKNGLAHGRGIYVYPSGIRYEGEWREGREHGVGTLIELDGSTFYGFWLNGQLHGEGVYKRASGADIIMMREYAHGVLRKEAVLRVGQRDLRREEVKTDKALRSEEKRAAAKEHGKEARPGETIYKGHHSYDLMRNLQLGIIFSIAKTSKEAMEGQFAAPVQDEEFTQQVTQYFPGGEKSTSFKWKDYSPGVFNRLREAFGIDNKDYLLSLTGDKALRELPSPGKSGSVFFLSDDDRFIIKTVSHEEMLLLLRFIPAYYRHCAEYPTTLLTRFYGVHRIKSMTKGASKVRFVVMGNVFPTEFRIHRKYDLKGSTHGRTAGSRKDTDPETILKDLDIDVRLALAKGAHSALMKQIEADTALLARMHVMDYSLLLGVHYPKWGDNTWFPPHKLQGKRDEREQVELEKEIVESLPNTEEIRRALTKVDTRVLERNHNDHVSVYRGNTSTASHIPSSGVAAASNGGGPRSRPVEGAGGAGLPRSASAQEEAAGASGASAAETLVSSSDEQAAASTRQQANGHSGEAPALQADQSMDKALSNGTTEKPRGSSAGAPAAKTKLQFALEYNDPGSSKMLPSPFLEASSQAFDQIQPAAGQDPPKTGDTKERQSSIFNLSDVAQQRRSSVELGMGNASHSALVDPGSGGLKAGRLMSLHSALRAQLGVAVPAMALPRYSREDPETVLLFFGIVDFLQHYNFRKKSEHAFKSILLDSRLISVTDPKKYADRFCRFANDLFVARNTNKS